MLVSYVTDATLWLNILSSLQQAELVLCECAVSSKVEPRLDLLYSKRIYSHETE